MRSYKLKLQATALLIAIASQVVIAATPSPGCGRAPTLAGNTNTTHTITYNNKPRTFYTLTPSTYNNTRPHRLILTLHALAGTAEQVITGTGGYYAWYGLPPLSSSDDTIYIAPNGLDKGWANQNGEDVGFLAQLIQTVEADLCVDQRLRFSTGFSYGGAMSYALACALGEEIRGVAVLSGNPAISGCQGGSGRVAYYGQHGVADGVLPIEGGREMRDRFGRNNGCSGQGVGGVGGVGEIEEPELGSRRLVKTEMEGCEDGFPVVWVAFDGDHTPVPVVGGEERSFTPGETWEFFRRFE